MHQFDSRHADAASGLLIQAGYRPNGSELGFFDRLEAQLAINELKQRRPLRTSKLPALFWLMIGMLMGVAGFGLASHI
jgi:hypothetical protein